MTLTIFTQTEEIVNFSNLLKIYPTEGTYGDETVYAIVALPASVTSEDEATQEEQMIQLGIYDSEDKCRKVYDELIKWLKNGVQPFFEVPVSVSEE